VPTWIRQSPEAAKRLRVATDGEESKKNTLRSGRRLSPIFWARHGRPRRRKGQSTEFRPCAAAPPGDWGVGRGTWTRRSKLDPSLAIRKDGAAEVFSYGLRGAPAAGPKGGELAGADLIWRASPLSAADHGLAAVTVAESMSKTQAETRPRAPTNWLSW